MELIDIFLHIDTYLVNLTNLYGLYIYGLIFVVIFLETGVVVTPFLPGDSLLFAAGALSASSVGLNIWVLLLVVSAAAIIGDSVNYTIGKRMGKRAFENPDSKIFKKEYLDRTQDFYAKHGNRTIVLARFAPMIRTFAPFIAGVGKMEYEKFAFYNITGAVSWALIFCFGGYLFGNIQLVRDNFTLVIFGIIILSFLPSIYHLLLGGKNKKTPLRDPFVC